MEKTVKLKITGMHCVSCALTIDMELEDNGVKSSETNYARSETEVSFYENKISLEKIKSLIEKLGYKVEKT
jgi:Cu+-exporting ATPase